MREAVRRHPVGDEAGATSAGGLPLGLGLVREEQKVSVFAFDRFVESRKNHLVNAKVTLKTRKLEVYNARLKIVAELSGVRYFMYHWFFPSAVVGISNILFMEIFGLTTAVIVYLLAFGPPHFLLGGNVGGSRDSSANPSPYESPRGSVHEVPFAALVGNRPLRISECLGVAATEHITGASVPPTFSASFAP